MPLVRYHPKVKSRRETALRASRRLPPLGAPSSSAGTGACGGQGRAPGTFTGRGAVSMNKLVAPPAASAAGLCRIGGHAAIVCADRAVEIDYGIFV